MTHDFGYLGLESWHQVCFGRPIKGYFFYEECIFSPSRGKQSPSQPYWGKCGVRGCLHSVCRASTTIRQSTDWVVIHRQNFSIARGETTTSFVQPSASSAVLNRITSGDSSQILGHLQANGQVYLLNPNGFYRGPDAMVRFAWGFHLKQVPAGTSQAVVSATIAY